ncbi:hypothetical protein RvY_15217, partial [Ramazzottius varieornatus]
LAYLLALRILLCDVTVHFLFWRNRRTFQRRKTGNCLYNRTKAGVDTLDQLTGNYSCRRKTCRWPMALFYDLLDISAVNAYVIWCEVNLEWNLTLPTRRRIFLQELSKQMMKQQLQRRAAVPSLPFHMKKFISSMLQQNGISISIVHTQTHIPSKKSTRCRYCPRKSERRTMIVCDVCNTHVCAGHGNTKQTVLCLDYSKKSK